MTYVRSALPFVCVLLTLPGFGQATRTWVSSTGSDANPCTRLSPCQTFAGAIVKTAAGGEIDALDPAGYGTITITKAITIDGGGGMVSSILASATTGVTISVGSGDVVTLRNLTINGAGTTIGTNGVNITNAGTVHIEKCAIFGFSNSGVTLGGSNISLTLVNSQIQDISSTGVNVSGTGDTALLENVQILHTGTGIAAGDGTQITAHNMDIAYATNGATATSSAGGALVTLDTATVAYTTTAVQANGANSAVVLNDCTFSNNATVFGSGGGSIGSYGTNRVKPGNGTVGVITQTYGLR